MDTLIELQKRLAVCPADIQTRHALASLLEELGQHEEALGHWNAVLNTDPNNLKAREGVARCRQRSGRPLQSLL
jgi:thioredoxin-like negative regulator of GroEL